MNEEYLAESFKRNRPQIAALLTKSSITDILQYSDPLNITRRDREKIIEVYCGLLHTRIEAANAFLDIIDRTLCIESGIRLRTFCTILRQCTLHDVAYMIDYQYIAEPIDPNPPAEWVQPLPEPIRPANPILGYDPKKYVEAGAAFDALISFLQKSYFAVPDNVSEFSNWLLRQGPFVGRNFQFTARDAEHLKKIDQIMTRVLQGRLFHKDDIEVLSLFLNSAHAPNDTLNAVKNYSDKWIPHRT